MALRNSGGAVSAWSTRSPRPTGPGGPLSNPIPSLPSRFSRQVPITPMGSRSRHQSSMRIIRSRCIETRRGPMAGIRRPRAPRRLPSQIHRLMRACHPPPLAPQRTRGRDEEETTAILPRTRQGQHRSHTPLDAIHDYDEDERRPLGRRTKLALLIGGVAVVVVIGLLVGYAVLSAASQRQSQPGAGGSPGASGTPGHFRQRQPAAGSDRDGIVERRLHAQPGPGRESRQQAHLES